MSANPKGETALLGKEGKTMELKPKAVSDLLVPYCVDHSAFCRFLRFVFPSYNCCFHRFQVNNPL